MLDDIDHSRAGAYALQRAYDLARTLPVVVTGRNVDRETDNPGWVFDFEDEDRNVVVTYLDGSSLLARAITWSAALEHAQAGHRTSPQGLGDASGCSLCSGGELPSGITDKTFTHPQYVEPQPEVEPETVDA